MKPIGRLVFAWLVLLATIGIVRWIAGTFGSDAPGVITDALGQPFISPPVGLVGSTAGLGLLLLGAWLTGRIFRNIGLPMITGYLLFGVLVGPNLHALLPEGWPSLLLREELGYLKLIDALAISLIALTAGGEIQINEMKKNLAPVVWITIAGVLFPFVIVSGLLLLLRPAIPLLREVTFGPALVICLILGTVAIANSPASVIAMLKEMRADGPMSQIGLAVTVCKDLCLIVLFTVLISVSVTGLAVANAQQAGAGEVVAHLAWHLLGSIAVGVCIGAVMTVAARRVGNHVPLFTLAAGLGIALLCDALTLEPLLVALTSGFVMANLWPKRSARLFHAIEDLSLPVYCIFFAVAGAGIDIQSMRVMWLLALIIFVLRTMAIWGGTWIGVTGSGPKGSARKWLWTTFVAQAGVTVALASVVRDSFPDHQWADQLASLILAVVAMHQIAGPILMRIGLMRSGEAEKAGD